MPADASTFEGHRAVQFANTVFMEAQQSRSRLLQTLGNHMATGGGKKAVSFDGYGSLEAADKTSRLQKTEFSHLDTRRRWVQATTQNLATVIDHQDQLDMILDPTSPIRRAHAMAHARRIDSKIAEAWYGTAYEGEEAPTTPVAFSQVLFTGTNEELANAIAADYNNAGSVADGTPRGLTIAKLRAASRILSARHVIDDGISDGDASEPMAFIVLDPRGREELLESTEVTSSDYNTVKALVNGVIDTYMGFRFIRYNGIPIAQRTIGVARNIRRIPCYTKSYLGAYLQEQGRARADERSDISYAMQIYTESSTGFNRVEDEHFVEIECYQDNV